MNRLFCKKTLLMFSAILLTLCIVVSSNILSAKAEVIFEESNPEFKFKLYDSNLSILQDQYTPEGTFTPFDGEKYNIKTNAYVMWTENDDIAFAYKNYKVAYADKGKITVSATILSRDAIGGALHDNGSTGIAIRSGDSADAPSVYLHCRNNWIGIVYRTKKGAATIKSNEGDAPKFPVKLRLEKQGNTVNGYYQNNGSNNWVKLNTVYVKMDETVMAGIAAHSCSQQTFIDTSFNDFKVSIEGPAGSKYNEDTDPSSGSSSSEEENKLPPDPPLTDNILFRETFTDGSLVNKNEDGKETADNPYWDNGENEAQYADIVTDGDNRYWHRSFSTDDYHFDNDSWADYSLSADLKFGKETIESGVNQVNFYVRHRKQVAYGYFGYRVSLEYGKYVRVYKYFMTGNYLYSHYKIAETALDETYLDKDNWHTWTVDAFDNKITVYRDGEVKCEAVDNDIGNISVNGFGGIGFGSDGADLYVDNIIVRKLDDLMGGSYDNFIGGNWDSDVPDYIKDYKSEYKYY